MQCKQEETGNIQHGKCVEREVLFCLSICWQVMSTLVSHIVDNMLLWNLLCFHQTFLLILCVCVILW